MSEIGDDDKRQFFEDGFLIVRNAVSSELVARAKALIEEAIPEDERHLLVPGKLATHDDVTGLFNNSALADIIERLMGPFPPVISCQVAVTPPFNLLGGKPGHSRGWWLEWRRTGVGRGNRHGDLSAKGCGKILW